MVTTGSGFVLSSDASSGASSGALACSQALRLKIGLAEARLHPVCDCFWSHARLAALYPRFLVQLYHVVRGGLELMRFAAERGEALAGDHAAGVAAGYLRRHIEEERDHAEWLLRDLEVLGVSRAAVLRSEPLPAVAALMGWQCFWIGADERGASRELVDTAAHPCSVFGYLLVLEGSPPRSAELDAMERQTGLPREAFACLRSHGEDDPAHLAELNETLDAMALGPEQQGRVALSAFATIDGVASLLEELLAELPEELPERAAGGAVGGRPGEGFQSRQGELAGELSGGPGKTAGKAVSGGPGELCFRAKPPARLVVPSGRMLGLRRMKPFLPPRSGRQPRRRFGFRHLFRVFISGDVSGELSRGLPRGPAGESGGRG